MYQVHVYMLGAENAALAGVHNCHRCDYKPACL